MRLSPGFDPLVDLAGCWTTALAERYLPIRELAGARHECVAGRLVLGPFRRASESFGTASLACALIPNAEATGRYVHGRVNLTFAPDTWIQPDITVLHSLPATDDEDRWIPVDFCTMAVEVVSGDGPESPRVDRAALCAERGVPYFLRVRIDRAPAYAEAELLGLGPDGRYGRVAAAVAGRRLRADLPFPIDFDPADLLP
ncbi:Uma2 family endonuclease [Micromonospora sp. PLK6-60]|uniref:Uma2 family endonuclease n=1 Tax=Micromonospora sp. PLK6-60 TaxID=2873383 RepID=UPI001CA62A41|nr:Uma2 family endonuclease [Micromonospora sp. PLK6-60]MBY8872846.1 Uma2 family endonuclease [Micromonospora sp. PLK6-60]